MLHSRTWKARLQVAAAIALETTTYLLNEGRHLKKRVTEFRIDQVLQPFDDNKFNFTKVGQLEILFMLESSNDNELHYFPSSAVDVASSSHSVVAINRIDHESFLFALHLAREAADPAFRMGYNSSGAFATISHLRFQVPTDARVIVSKLLDYLMSGLIFTGGCTLHNLSDVVADSCIFLQNNNIPIDVLIADYGRRIYLLPQCYAEKQALGEVERKLLDSQVNPAVWEIGGHIA
ncbi:unnamed protein product [Fraxinus pennsylvanica]|uniref:GDP-D-glucose phosphorylase 1 n=1 Tax=Fraxinus pennsylvanica TaxID=56036 RepID=A0AAD1YMH2_9LAMI|nr:unnamed protein product [Fraxinus pennsylvanica]